MAQRLAEVMTHDPVTLTSDASVQEAARIMRQRDIGTVLVLDNEKLTGVVTDRDIVVRAVADRTDLSDCRLADVCSSEVVTATPEEDIDAAVARMREHAVRRIAVVENGRPVGMFSIGDAAVEKDSDSALADISAATANS